MESHFAEEEELQRSYGYPDYQRHHSRHETFIRNLAFISDEIEGNRITSALVMQVNQLLIDWMTYHIATDDRKVGEFIAKHPT